MDMSAASTVGVDSSEGVSNPFSNFSSLAAAISNAEPTELSILVATLASVASSSSVYSVLICTFVIS